jgi:hypothetical protein
MKRFHLIFPKKNAVKWVEYAHGAGITNALSWYQETDAFSFSNVPTGINVIALTDEAGITGLLASEWKQYLQS